MPDITGFAKIQTPLPSHFNPICHPLVDSVSKGVDEWFLQNWGFASEKARKKFVAAGFSRVTCLYFPKALDSRIRHACELLTILFLIDDHLEDLSLQDGEAYNEHLMPLMQGIVQPDKSVAVEWMMYTVWEKMRACDSQLADEVLEPTFTFMRAQTSKLRLNINGLGHYLKYRQEDVGQDLLSSLMRFSMGLHLTHLDRLSVYKVEQNCGRHIAIINDIFSFEKELRASETAHHEGGVLCSAVQIFATEAELNIPAAKRVLWTMCREWEVVHRELVKERKARPQGCSETVQTYMEAHEYFMSGNERWSQSTKRYSSIVD